MRAFTLIALAVWLIATGLFPMLGSSVPYAGSILGVLAIAVGVLILLDFRGKSAPGTLGFTLLAIWLILSGVLPLLPITIPAASIVLGVLAVAAGVLILLRR